MKRSQKFVQALANTGVFNPEHVVIVAGEVTLVWSERAKLRDLAVEKVFVPTENLEMTKDKALEVLCPEEVTTWPDDRGHGGYRPLFGERYAGATISKVRIPDLKNAAQKRLFRAAVQDLMGTGVPVVFARIDGGHVTLVRKPGGTWMSMLSGTGIRLVLDAGAEKVDKRSSILTNLYPMTVEVPTAAIDLVVEDDPSLEKVLDGAFFIGKGIAALAIESIDVPLKDDDDAGRAKRTAQWRKSKLVQRAVENRIWHARIVVPGVGLLKGHAIVSDELAPMQIVTHGCNIKSEVTGAIGWHMGFEPMPAKSTARTSIQATLSFPMLFPIPEQRRWADAYAEYVKKEIKEGRPLDTFDGLVELHKELDGGDLDSFMLESRWRALYAVDLGLDFRHMPSLVKSLTQAGLVSMRWRNPETGKVTVNVPIPSACEWQIVSQTVADLAGSKLVAKDGEVRMDEDFGFAVVSDQTWLEMQPVHGGCDQDDKFVLCFRDVAGAGKKVFAFRNPSDRGEYTILDYHTGDYHPASAWWTEAPFFPKVDLSKECPRTTGITGTLPKGEGRRHGEYDLRSFAEGLDRALGGSNPGSIVNAKMLWNSTHFGEQLNPLFATMEQVVDTCTQGGSPETIAALQKWGEELVLSVVEEGRSIDPLFWKGCGFRIGEKDTQPSFKAGWLSNLFGHVDGLIAKSVAEMDVWAQSKHAIPEELFPYAQRMTPEEGKQLGLVLRDYKRAAATLCRLGVQDKEVWSGLTSCVLDAIGKDPAAPLDRIGKFAYLVHNTPDSRGKISDRILLAHAVDGKHVSSIAGLYFEALAAGKEV